MSFNHSYPHNSPILGLSLGICQQSTALHNEHNKKNKIYHKIHLLQISWVYVLSMRELYKQQNKRSPLLTIDIQITTNAQAAAVFAGP